MPCANTFLITAYVFVQTGAGYVSDRRTAELRIAIMWQDFIAVATAAVLLLTKLPALLA